MSHAMATAILDFQQAWWAVEKAVSIEIGSDDLKILKASNYKLCFAKIMGGDTCNVVWQAYSNYLSFNNFSFVPSYQLFGSSLFVDGVTAIISTNRVSIGLGEQSTLDNAGILSPASTGGPPTAITMINLYGPIHPGMSQLSTGINGEQSSTPIYVSAIPIVIGTMELMPTDKVLVWFEQNIDTGTMFSNQRSNAVKIDLTEENNATRLYKDGRWSTP